MWTPHYDTMAIETPASILTSLKFKPLSFRPPALFLFFFTGTHYTLFLTFRNAHHSNIASVTPPTAEWNPNSAKRSRFKYGVDMMRHAEDGEETLPLFALMKKQLRSKLPRRRRRFGIPSVLVSFFLGDRDRPSLLATEDFSCESYSSRASAIKRCFEENANGEFQRVTRPCYDWIKEEKDEFVDAGEASETSCVESCSGAVSGMRNEKSRLYEPKGFVERAEDSEPVNKSEISAVTSFVGEIWTLRGEKTTTTENSLEINSNDVVSVHSVLQSTSESKFGRTSENHVRKSENGDEGEEESGADSREDKVPIYFDFTCSENLTNAIDCEPYGDSPAYSELHSKLFAESSEFDFSDYTPSIWFDSGSQFSDKSINDESPSPTFQLFVQYSKEFCKSSFALDSNSGGSSPLIDSHEITLLGLEEKDDQESYKMIRMRERKQVYLRDYATEYCFSTDCGDLIIQQRSKMVHWIVEQSTAKELQKETLFLGVNLLDRFLSNGYFKTKRNLQIAGIACLTLATRIEENQPLNSVAQKTFQIGTNVYSRCEVVAMEWLVQEVLKFQCLLPSIYNFLGFYLKAAKASEKVEKNVKYLAMLTLLGQDQLCFWPSTLAAVLVILASKAVKQEASCYNIRQIHARVMEDHLPECMKKFSWLVTYIN